MANFETAYKITMKNEGGYSKDPHDVGGETYKGISRVFWPNWKGWKTIDFAKTTGRSFPDVLANNDFNELNKVMVPEFYKTNFWNRFIGDKIEHQIIANELFDTGVNMSVSRAVSFLQDSLNFLYHRKGIVMTNELSVDGIFGNKTFTALNTIKPDSIKLLYKLMNIMQGNHYVEQFRKNPKTAIFMVGWLNRVDFTKE